MSNDADLDTGVNGFEAFSNEKQSDEQTRMLEEQKNFIASLLPNADAIQKTIDEERAAVCDIRAYMKTLGNNPSREEIEGEYRGRELYMEFLDRFESNVLNNVSHAKEYAE